MNNYKLILMDIDGTIADRDSVEIYPAARRFIEALDSSVDVALITNQGGPACHDASWGFSDKFPSLEEVEGRLTKISQALPDGRHYEIFIAYAYKQKNGEFIYPNIPKGKLLNFYACLDPAWRKPSPIMLLTAMREFKVTPTETLMIGDRPEDRGAAETAGVAFRHVDDI